MSVLVFLLVMLVIIDHVLKYRPQSLVFYKNAHKYSVIIALLEEPPHLDDLVDMALKSPHEFIFVNVNHAVDPSLYPEVTIIDLDYDGRTHPSSVPLLDEAYLQGYVHANNNFLLFMNGSLRFSEAKILTHMANNLVEHQLYTVKEDLPKRTNKEGYKIFFDLFDDMETTTDKVNFNFFSIKRETFKLAKCHEQVFKDTHQFEKTLHLKNITILYIEHNGAIKRVEKHKAIKPYTREWFKLYNHKAFHGGFRRMLAFLLAFHVFYIFMVLDFRVVSVLFIPLVHLAFYLVVGHRAKHGFWAFILIPFYMFLFDLALLTAVFKRILFKRKIKKKQA